MSDSKWAGSSEKDQSRWAILVSKGISLCGDISKIMTWLQTESLELKERIKYIYSWYIQLKQRTCNQRLKHNPNPRENGLQPVTMYLLIPGTIKDSKWSTALIVLYLRGCRFLLKSLECCFWNMPQTRSSTHLRGGHRSPFEFKVTHIGYGPGKTWEKQSVVVAYSMKSSHPNYTLFCDNFKELKMSLSKTMIDDILPYVVPRYWTDEDCSL